METTRPVVTPDLSHQFFPVAAPPPAEPVQAKPWLLELEADGTIRYSSYYPYSADSKTPVVGTNFFELQNVGDLAALRRDFVEFVKGDKNRQAFHLTRLGDTQGPPASVVLTRSFDRTEAGASCVVVLMELKGI